MASPSLLLGSLRGSPRPPSGQRGSACEASAWRTCGGAELHARVAPAARGASSAPNVFFRAPSKTQGC
eukprot:2240567-Alexandrium_andersonii.AAC.1